MMKTLQLEWDNLTWEDFQGLSKYFAEEVYPGSFFTEYLKPGHDQDGIDILHYSTLSGKHICVQCKHVKAIKQNDISNIVNDFKAGAFYSTTSTFILCTTADLQKREIQIKLRDVQETFRKENIEFHYWDVHFLGERLKGCYSLVASYFGLLIAEGYCFKQDYRDKWQTNHPPENYIQREVVKFKSPDLEQSSYRYLHYRNDEKVNLVELFTIERIGTKKICLIGDAYQGKSQLMRHLAFELEKLSVPYKCFLLELKQFNVQPIDGLLDKAFANWKLVPAKDTVLLIDGLDEVPTDQFDEAARHIKEFSLKYPTLNLILTCRKIFFYTYNVQTTINTFNVLELYPLTQSAISNYIYGLLGDRNKQFIKLVGKYGVEGFLFDPFYLVKLVDTFKNTNKIPKRKTDIIKEFIDSARSKEGERRVSNGKFLSHRNPRFQKAMQKFAFAMQLCGLNAIEKDQLEIVLNEEEMDLIQHSSLVINFNGRLSFTNAIFQEHLAALLLAECDVDIALDYISIGASLKKLKKKWIQTVGSLLSILPKGNLLHESILEFLRNDNIELVFTTESSKFIPSERKLLVQGLIERCIAYHIRPMAIDEETVGGFIDGDSKSIDAVISTLGKSDVADRVKIVCIRILKRVELQREQKSVIYKIASEQLNENTDKHFGNEFLEMLAQEEIGDRALLDTFIKLEKPNVFHDFRDGVYQVITALNLADDYYEYALAGFEHLIYHNRTTSHWSSEGALETLLLSTKNIKCLTSLLHIMKTEKWQSFYRYRANTTKFLELLCEKLVIVFDHDPTILFKVVDFVKSLSKYHLAREFSAIYNFFRLTRTNWIAARLLHDTIIKKRDWGLAGVLTEECFPYLLFEFEEVSMPSDTLWTYYLGVERPGDRRLANRFLQYCNEATEYEFSKRTASADEYDIDHQTKRQNDLIFIRNQKSFRRGIIAFFEACNKTEFEKGFRGGDLHQIMYGHKDNSEFVYNYIVNWRGNANSLSLEKTLSRVNDASFFKFFRASEILYRATHFKDELPAELRQILQDYYLEQLPRAKFERCSWRKKGSDTVTFLRMEHFLGEIYEEFAFETPSETLIQMIWLDRGGIKNFENCDANKQKAISQIIISKLDPSGIELLKQSIVTNIRGGISDELVLGNHIGLCRHLKIFDAKNDILDLICQHQIEVHSVSDVIDVYLELGGNIGEMVTYFKEITDYNSHTYSYMVAKLYDDYADDVKTSLYNCLNSSFSSEEAKINAARYLSSLGELKGFEYLVTNLNALQAAPYAIQRALKVANVDIHAALSLLEGVMHLILTDSGHSRSFHDSARSILLEWLYGFAEKGEKETAIVYEFLLKHERLSRSNYPNHKDYFWYAFQVIEKFRNADKSNCSISEAAKILGTL